MKSTIMGQLFLILICVGANSIVSAQTDYVVTIKGDTIHGKVKYLNFGAEKSVQITSSDKKKKVYPILQTKGFQLDSELYHPVRTPQGYTYMKVLNSGYLSLYAFQIENQSTWDGRFLLKKDGTSKEVPNIGFKKILSQFLSECPQVASRIESGELSKTKINEIVDAYNACIQANTLNQKMVEAVSQEKTNKVNTWTELETAIKNGNDFESRTDALDMITEVKSKISKGEKVPKFISEGLKGLLKDQSAYTELLNKAISELE